MYQQPELVKAKTPATIDDLLADQQQGTRAILAGINSIKNWLSFIGVIATIGLGLISLFVVGSILIGR